MASKAPKQYSPSPPPPGIPGGLFSYSHEHVYYEVFMFFDAFVAKRAKVGIEVNQNAPLAGRFITNAMTEAFALHARNLIEFCYPDNWRSSARETDVLAYHFFPSFEAWKAVRPAISGTLVHAKSRTDTELAHLTTKRIAGSGGGKAWDFVGLGDEVRTVLRVFVEKAKPELLSSRVATAIPEGDLTAS